mmetsp:Transcript_37467/g.98270  ORF Transcript_37467/g.98270 Transcript_37467/m.98270 type:complete len:448 (-) Transcript_37467:258-1601(-)
MAWGCRSAVIAVIASPVAVALLSPPPPPVPHFPATWHTPSSTFVMACNYSDWLSPAVFSRFGVVDIDWSNGKEMWANEHPMDAEAAALHQAALIKNAACPQACPLPAGCPTRQACPQKRVWVYKNLVKALAWMPTVRAKLSDPQYADFFVPFVAKAAPNGSVPSADVPACDKNFNPARCSHLYHDQVQTPQYPHGGLLDGSCTAPCDCDSVPCGEYVWDHRNGSELTSFLVDEYFGGPAGLGSPNVDGFLIDDGWLPWHGRNGTIPGGPTEMDRDAVRDMGLTRDDVYAMFQAWEGNVAKVLASVATKGGWTYNQLLAGGPTFPRVSSSACTAAFRAACPTEGRAPRVGLELYSLTSNHSDSAKVDDLAAFLLTRGPYSLIGWGWRGTCNVDYEIPDDFLMDHGVPTTNCTETGADTAVFTREWTRASVTIDCNSLTSSIKVRPNLD